MNNQREKFEAWMRENKPTFSLSISSSKPDQYNYVSTNYLWTGYQAALSAVPAQEPITTLSGAAQDVLAKLMKFRALDDGDLPSKSGMIELIKIGLAEKDYSLPNPNVVTAKGLLFPYQQPAQEPVKPTEQQILAAAEKAGLWPNTVYTWLPAFHRYHAELAKLNQEPVKQERWISVEEAKTKLKDGDLLYVAFVNGDVSEAIYKWEQGYYPHRIESEKYGNERLEICTHVMPREPVPLPLPPVVRNNDEPVKEVTE